MKKFIAVLLVISSLMMFSACRETEISSGDETTNDALETTVSKETESEADESDTEAETDADTESETDAITEAPAVTDAVTDTETEAETDSTVSGEMNEMNAVKIARQYLGEVDPDTGYQYSYQFVEITTEGDYKIKVSWYIEEDERFSKLGYLLVSPDGKVTKFDW